MKPTIRELLETANRYGLRLLAERVEVVLKLHHPRDPEAIKKGQSSTCVGCGVYWPCPTIRALEGER